jgi:extradiol dioxygenase
MKVSSLGYVGVGSVRAKEWEAFGPEILGTPLWNGAQDGVYLRLDERAYRIAVHPAERDELQYIGWEMGNPTALEEAAEELKARGFAVERGAAEDCKRRHVEGMIAFRDPWNIRHEMFYGQRSLMTFRPTREISGFVTGELGLGHIVLVLPELAAATRFFVDVLGFRVSDYIDVPFPLAFYHCNPRHHTVAVGAMGRFVGFHHIMLEVKDLNDVGTTYDLCKKRGVPFAMDLGRHSNDRMLSFYVRTPGGFEIEYGWGGLLVDDAKWQVQRLPLPSFWGHHGVSETPPTTVYPV